MLHADYKRGNPPSFEEFLSPYLAIFTEPRVLLAGIPFSFTLISILLAHELGHYFACRYYSISASYPYFLPAPTLFGTLGAFIRIRSPIINRKALFDVGLAGPVVGNRHRLFQGCAGGAGWLAGNLRRSAAGAAADHVVAPRRFA